MKKFNFIYLFSLILLLNGLTCKAMEKQSTQKSSSDIANDRLNELFDEACEMLDNQIQELKKNNDPLAKELINIQAKLSLIGVNNTQMPDFYRAIREQDWQKLINLFSAIDLTKEQDKINELLVEMLSKAAEKLVDHINELSSKKDPLAFELIAILLKIQEISLNQAQIAKFINAVNAEDWDAIINLYND